MTMFTGQVVGQWRLWGLWHRPWFIGVSREERT